MFLSRREGRQSPGGAALTGPVTVPGQAAGAYLEGERRELEVFVPGGYHWAPALGDQVLVLKAGESGEKPCVVGKAMEVTGLEPGEVMISAGEGSVTLRPGGEVEIRGHLTVNGREVMLEPLEKGGA